MASSPTSSALQFYDALVDNDLAALKRIVEVHRIDLTSKFAQVRKKNHADLFPVHLVTYKGYLPLLHYLIEAGVDVNQTTATLHRQAVHFAALKHQLPCLKRLIISGANIDAKDTFGNTPLHYAAEDGSIFLMTLLMQENANLDAQDITNKTPLMKATRNGKINAVKRLVSAGCSVNLKDKNDDTALHYTARYGSVEMTNILLRANAKIDAQNQWGLTPLMEAVSYNQLEVVALLSRNNCDLYKRDFRTGDTALHIAVKKNYIEICKVLTNAGKWYIEYNFNNFGESFIHDAVVYNRMELLRLFVIHNYNLDYPAKKLPGVAERWPFLLAIDRGHWDMARIISRVACVSCRMGVALKKYVDLEEVKSLKMWSRKVIRKQLGFNAEEKIDKLPVPNRLKNYLRLDDLDWQASRHFP